MGRQQRYDRVETLEKAMNLFWKSGFSGTSMRDLEEGLDMRPGSIYANFGNKELLYQEAMSLYADITFDLFQTAMAEATSFMAGLRQFITPLLFTPDTPLACMLAKTLADMSPDNKALQKKAGMMIAGFEEILISELEKAQTTGEVTKNCHVKSLAQYIQVQIIGLRSYAELQRPRAVIEGLLNDSMKAIQAKAGGE